MLKLEEKTFYHKLIALDKRIGFVGAMVIMLLLWIPTWLSVFPGVFSYDAYDEWQQVVTGNITAHHPVLHVLFLGGIVARSSR